VVEETVKAFEGGAVEDGEVEVEVEVEVGEEEEAKLLLRRSFRQCFALFPLKSK